VPAPSGSIASSAGTATASLASCTANSEYGTVGGTACGTCNAFEPCSAVQQGKNTSCEPGYEYKAATDQCLESKSQADFTGIEAVMTATIDSRRHTCEEGFMRGKAGAGGAFPDGTDYQCLQCPDLQVCLV